MVLLDTGTNICDYLTDLKNHFKLPDYKQCNSNCSQRFLIATKKNLLVTFDELDVSYPLYDEDLRP